MEDHTEDVCCPKFDLNSYNNDGSGNPYKLLTWNDKPFVKDGTWCILYVPLAFGRAVVRVMKQISDAGAEPPKSDVMILSDCTSPWYTNIYVSTTKDDVPGVEVQKISGTFLAKAYEGDYSNMGKWATETKELVKTSKMSAEDVEKMQIYFYYPTCPKCAKKYGNNYVVVLAKLS
ncbi:hypothetical protein ACHAXH_001918 [Discostella pseudostelligera]|jgi:hypothetical protein